MIHFRTILSLLLFTQAFLAMAAPVPSGYADTTVSLNEVTVTAIKQSANLRNQATASTIINRTDVERDRLVSAKSASDAIPNLFIPDYGSRMTSTIYVRGLGARIDQPTVGLNIDNIPVLCKENYDFDIPDISRIEMLRGPQSTLYGRNTMGGVMNIYTLSPLSYQGLRLLGEYATANSYRAGGSYYDKINNRLGIAAGCYYTSTDGMFTNDYNGKKCDWEHMFSGRLKLQWMPSATLSITNTLMLSTTRQGGYPYEYSATHRISYNDTCFYRRTSILDGLTIMKQLSNFTLSSITSFQYIDDNMTLDQDFLPEPYFTLTQDRNEYAFTQDFIARSTWNKPYKWLTGLFGFYRHYNMDAPVTFKDTGIAQLIEDHTNAANPSYPIKWDTREFVLGSNFVNPTYGLALYHQSSYDWNNLVFTAGMRVDYEHTSLDYHSETHTGYSILQQSNGALYRHDNIDIDDGGKLHKDFLQLLPKLSITYNPATAEPTSIYLSVSKGYKAGGFNTQMFSDVLQQRLMGMMGIGASYDINRIVSYKPEKAWNYELGGHFECWNGRVKSDLDLFYIDCTDRQLTVFPDGTTTGRIMTNAGKTRSYGAEFAISMKPADNIGIDLSYGYTHAKFVKYNDGKADYAHRYVPYSPDNTLFTEAYYTFNISGIEWLKSITASANMRGVGQIYWNESNSMKQPFYALLGSALTLAGKHYSLQLWGRNLTDTKYDTFYFVSIGHEFLQRGKKRMVGITLNIDL